MEVTTETFEYVTVRMTKREADAVVATIQAGIDCIHRNRAGHGLLEREYIEKEPASLAEDVAQRIDEAIGGGRYEPSSVG